MPRAHARGRVTAIEHNKRRTAALRSVAPPALFYLHKSFLPGSLGEASPAYCEHVYPAARERDLPGKEDKQRLIESVANHHQAVTHCQQFVLSLAALLVVGALAGCGQQQAPPPRAAAPVTVTTVAQRDIPVDITAIGNVEAMQTVQIRSMVNGQIDQVLFKEGQEVRKGELLFKLDQSPFIADLNRNTGKDWLAFYRSRATQ